MSGGPFLLEVSSAVDRSNRRDGYAAHGPSYCTGFHCVLVWYVRWYASLAGLLIVPCYLFCTAVVLKPLEK